ncbi:hypothetical protein D3C73_715670 [compost metagenome]
MQHQQRLRRVFCMDNLIVELEQLTHSGLASLALMDDEQFAEFMEQRGRIVAAIGKLAASCSDTDKQAFKQRVQVILSYDDIFMARMNKLKQEAADQLAKLDAGRTQRNAYDNDYDAESFFFDRKK